MFMIRSAAHLTTLTALTLALAACAAVDRPEATDAAEVEAELELVAALDKAPGNITVTPDGLVVFSLHQHFEPELRVVALGKAQNPEDGDGEPSNLQDVRIEPFPDGHWNAGDAPGRLALDSVLGIQSDTRGIVWMLDNGMRNDITPKLVAWDTRRDRLHRIIHLPPPLVPEGQFVNDLAVDLTHDHIYIADPAGGENAALIVVELRTGHARRVLEGHQSVVPEDIDMVFDGRPAEILGPDGETFRPRVGVNPIALDAADEWLYYGPMSGTTMYRIRTADLRNRELDDDQLAQRVQAYADKPIGDGISIDNAGNIYISAITDNAIGVIDTDRQYRILFQDDELLQWPDAFSFGPDGKMYVVANQLHRGPVLNAGEDETEPPYYIFRFRPLAPGTVGR